MHIFLIALVVLNTAVHSPLTQSVTIPLQTELMPHPLGHLVPSTHPVRQLIESANNKLASARFDELALTAPLAAEVESRPESRLAILTVHWPNPDYISASAPPPWADALQRLEGLRCGTNIEYVRDLQYRHQDQWHSLRVWWVPVVNNSHETCHRNVRYESVDQRVLTDVEGFTLPRSDISEFRIVQGYTVRPF